MRHVVHVVNTTHFSARGVLTALGIAILSAMSWHVASAAVTVLGVQYQPDKMHPEFDCIWNNSNYPTSCPSNFAGANVHVYLRNDERDFDQRHQRDPGRVRA